MTNGLTDLALRGGPPPQGLEQVYATSLWKCFSQPYLARSIDPGDALRCFLSSYTHLADTLPFAVVERMTREDVPLLVRGNYRVTAKLEHVIPNEGELTLEFRAGAHALYGMSFGVVPGRCVGESAREVLLITRMQGRFGEAARIAEATAAFGEITPQHILYCAVTGIAASCRIHTVLGVSALNQISYKVALHDIFMRAYDRFYLEVSGHDRADGFFRLPSTARGRPLSEIVSWHRRRTRRKREHKRQIAAAVQVEWQHLSRCGAA